MFSSWICIDLSQHERLEGFPRNPKDFEGQKDYFMSRARMTKDPIESDNFLKIFRILKLAKENGAVSVVSQLVRSDVKQPVFRMTFEFWKVNEMISFDRLIRKTES